MIGVKWDGEKIKTLKDRVELVLAKNPATRNSDELLSVITWMTFHPKLIRIGGTGKACVWCEDIVNGSLTQQSAIERMRRQIQNVEHKYLPTDWKVAKARNILEEVWREEMAREAREAR